MCKLAVAIVARQCDNLMCWLIVCEFELDAVVSNQYIVKVLVLSCITFEQKIHSSDVLNLVMLNKCPTLHLNFYPVNLQHSSCKHVFSNQSRKQCGS